MASTDHPATIAGVTDRGHWYCQCGRKVISVGRDAAGGIILRHTSGRRRIDGRPDNG